MKKEREDLIEEVAAYAGLTKKDAKAAVAATFEVIRENLIAGHELTIRGFGTFSRTKTRERSYPNPQKAGEKIVKPAGHAPKLKFGKLLKEQVYVAK